MVTMGSEKEPRVDVESNKEACSSSVPSTTVTPITATFSDSAPLSSQTLSSSPAPPAPALATPSPAPTAAPTPAQAPKEAQTKKTSKLPTKCPLEKCLLCTREQPLCLMRSSTWPAIMRVVFYTLKYNNPEKEFFNLKDDVYSVMLFHWNKLAIHKKSASNWKKHIQDMLSHSKDIFESGLEIYGQNGYWRLKVNTDPWTLSGKTRRSPKKALMKRSLEDTPMAEQMPRRPFIPYIAKEPGKYTESYQQPVSYVFINEHSSPPVVGNTRKEEIPPPPAAVVNSPTNFIPNPFNQQRLTFIPVPFQQQMAQSVSSPVFAHSPQVQSLHLQQILSPSLQSFLSHPRLAVSLPSSRMASPQRSRSPSPTHTQSLPGSPRGINHPIYPSFSPISAPASPVSSPRASPYPIPKRKSVTQPPSPRSRPMSPHSRPRSPRSQPISPRNSPPSSPRMRLFRGLMSPPSPQSPLTPATPLSPHSPVQEDNALDSLRNTFEQFHWQTSLQQQPQQILHQLQNVQAGINHSIADINNNGVQPMDTTTTTCSITSASMEPHHLAFNVFAAAKPANPCDVSFILNE